jgi:hypothetical protein
MTRNMQIPNPPESQPLDEPIKIGGGSIVMLAATVSVAATALLLVALLRTVF